MNTIVLLTLMLLPQTPSQPLAQTPPGQPQNGAGGQGIIAGGGGQQQIPQTTQPNLQNGQSPFGNFGSMYQMPVDGTYQVLAYEKFGQVLPGMNTLKVTIRNNILTFPSEGRMAGKMIQLAFGPANTIMLTPIDNRQDTIRTTGSNSPNNVVHNNAGQNNNVVQGGNNNSGIMNPPSQSQSEVGVYVLSNEYFAISVTGKHFNNDNTVRIGDNQAPINGQPPVNGQTTINGQFPGNGQSNNNGQATGNVPPAAGRTIPGNLPPIGGGSNLTAQPGAGGTNAVLPGTNRAGANQTGQGNTGIMQIPGNGTGQQPTSTNPPGSPNQAVLVLRRVAN